MESNLQKESLQHIASELAQLGRQKKKPLTEEEIVPLLERYQATLRPEVTEVRPQELECDVVRFQNNKDSGWLWWVC